jgi:hypothetical protein
MTLIADLWDGDYASPSPILHLGPVSPWAEWSQPGGLQRFGLRVRREGPAAYIGYSTWEGKRLVVHDEFCDQPVLDGTVIATDILTSMVDLLAAGPWWRLLDDCEESAPAKMMTSDVIKEAITNHGSIVSTVVDGICATTVDADGFALPAGGLTVARLIEEMLLGGDGAGNPLVFWIEAAPFNISGVPQKPLAMMESLSTTASINWQIWSRQKMVGSNTAARDIGDLATSVKAQYSNAGTLAVTAAATNNTTKYWTRKRNVSGRGATSTIATAVRDAELARLSNPQLRRQFTLGTAELMDGYGGRWPTWRMLIRGGYLRDNDVGPDDGLALSSLDYQRVGRITSMRYDHGTRQMQVSLNTDLRLDTVLATFGYDWRLADQLERELAPAL